MRVEKILAFGCVVMMLVLAGTVRATEIFSEDFESTGVADGDFTSDWPSSAFSSVNGPNLSNLLNPSTGSPWLDPVPAALGEIFGVLHSGGIERADLTNTYTANMTYTLTFTQFRRDDIAGEAVAVRIMTTGGTTLTNTTYAAITTMDTYVTNSLVYTTPSSGSPVGEAIRIEFEDSNGGTAIPQVGIDNISLSTGAAPDPGPPVIASLSPVNGANGVSGGANLVATFNRDVKKGTGNILIREYAGDATVHTIAVVSNAVTISGRDVTIDPPADLGVDNQYYVEIASGAILDLTNAIYMGMSGKTNWSFTVQVPLFDLPLSNPGGGTANEGTPAMVLSDAFSYNPDDPSSASPNHTWNFPTVHFFLSNPGVESYWFAEVSPGSNSVDYIDVWGNDHAGHESLFNGRTKDLVFSFYTSTNATTGFITNSASWTGVEWNGDNPDPTFGRFDVSTVIPRALDRTTIRSFRIDHGADANLELYEVRAAGSLYVPPPTGTVLVIR